MSRLYYCFDKYYSVGSTAMSTAITTIDQQGHFAHYKVPKDRLSMGSGN